MMQNKRGIFGKNVRNLWTWHIDQRIKFKSNSGERKFNNSSFFHEYDNRETGITMQSILSKKDIIKTST